MKRIIFSTVIFCSCINLFGQTGRVGINTATPQALLHVNDSAVVFTGYLPLIAEAITLSPPVSGAGTRMMWYPGKAAFRSGSVDGSQWNKSSVGRYSIATGFNTEARGLGSVSMGLSSVAYSDGTVAIGSSADALLSFSVAIGNSAVCMNTNSYALGTSVKATGRYATALGAFATARSYNSFVVGRFNDTIITSNTESWVDSDPLFIIGNGSAHDTRKNAMTVLKNGNVGINIAAPDAVLHVVAGSPSGGQHAGNAMMILDRNTSSSIQFSNPSNATASILSGNTETNIRSGIIFDVDSSVDIRAGGNANRLAIYKNGNVGINWTAPAALLHLKAKEASYNMHIRLDDYTSSDYGAIVYDGSMKFRTFGTDDVYQWRDFNSNTRMQLTSAGDLSIDGTLSQASDIRLKKNINPLQNSVQKLLLLSGYHYNWKDVTKNNELQTGLLAQEVEEQMPELVKTNEEGIKSVNYMGMIPYLVEAVKELKKENDELKKQVADLKNQIIKK